MSDFFDELDTQDPQRRITKQFSALGPHLQNAVESCPGIARHLAGIDVRDINDLESLQRLPVLRKSDLMEAQKNDPPFGGFVNAHALPGCRVFMSPGPVWEPQIGSVDSWQVARALYATGFRRGDRVQNTFSYHLTPGGFMLDDGAIALGCSVFPAGTCGTETQLEILKQFGATAFVGTPDYLKIVLDKRAELSVSLPSLKRAMVSGGALFPAMRDEFAAEGIHVQQCYATADLGVIAYETATDGVIHPGMVLNENIIVEVVKPGTGEPVGADEVGEIVVTRLHPDYPLVRFATGDLSAFIHEPSPCGRTQTRIKGWMGRADQRAKVRGMFVDPAQIQSVRSRHQAVDALRLQISRQENKDQLLLQASLSAGAADNGMMHEAELAESFKQVTGLSCDVTVIAADLPKDGIVIEDQRDFDQ